ncbi:EH domain-containing protein 4 [Grus japonensis]|uniref:EH domain-containing protein 4 n=1 Tax=Grus japonensis TaxID=30415 RepID=A0ABC9X3P6_GRUJA
MEDPTPEQVEAPEGGFGPVGSPRWSKLLAGPVDPWKEEPTPEQPVELSPDSARSQGVARRNFSIPDI